MSVRTRRRRATVEEGGHVDERWMASYLDMITVLMCLFIVLYAMSTVDKGKFEALSESLAQGFGQAAEKVEDEVPPPAVQGVPALDEKEPEPVTSPIQAAQAEFDELSELRERLRQALSARGVEDAATFTIDARGLTISLLSAETFFATNSTTLSGTAVTVLDALGGVLVTVDNEISVEGHADNRVSVAPFATNWELSAGRATQVLRHLVEVNGIAPAGIKSVGFGDARPIATGTDPVALAKNRRVDVVVLSNAEEEVRRLLPQLQAAQPTS